MKKKKATKESKRKALSQKQMKKISGGRVWDGGMVDELGRGAPKK